MKKKRILTICLIFCLLFQMALGSTVSAASKKPSLSRKSITLEVGKTATLRLKNAGESSIKWSTSSGAKASIKKLSRDNILITAKKAGTVKIKAKVGKKTYTCTVKVKARKEKPTLSSKTVNMVVGDTFVLSLKDNAKNTKWATSNKKALALKKLSKNKVKLTAKKKGTYKVTVKVSGKTYKCTVKITDKKKAVKVTKIDLACNGKLEVGNKVTVSANISPSNATDKTVTWSTGDKSIATVDQKGVVTLKKDGKVEIICSSGDGIKASIFLTVQKKASDVKKPETTPSTEKKPETTPSTEKTPETNKETESTTNPTEKQTEKPTEKPTEKQTEKSTEDETEKVTEKQTEKVTEVPETKPNTEFKEYGKVNIVGVPNTTSEVGSSFNLTSDSEVNWYSDNPSVATIEGNGSVKCVGSGVVVLSCTTKDGKGGSEVTIRVFDKVDNELPEEWRD